MKYIYLLLILCILPLATLAQIPATVSSNDFIKECVLNKSEGDYIYVSWWLPNEYWQILERESPAEAQNFQQISELLKDYVVIAVVEGKEAVISINFTESNALRKKVKFVDLAGNTHLPIEENKLSGDVKTIFGIFKPILQNMLGSMGEGITFMAFPAKDKGGKPTVDLWKKGSFKVVIGETDITYQLPLSAVLDPRQCPVDGEKMNGNWNFCPIHGQELKISTSAASK